MLQQEHIRLLTLLSYSSVFNKYTVHKHVRVYSLARPAWSPPTKAHIRRGTLAGRGGHSVCGHR